MPTTATSVCVTSSVRGRRAKVAGPAYRGTRVASTGPIGCCDVMPTRLPEIPASEYSQFVEIASYVINDMSMLTVAELIADADLGLELVAGRDGAEREIEAAAVSELAHPGPWLQGGELLLTIGLLLPPTTDGCRTYLAELDAAGVQAVGLGLGAELPHQRAPARLITTADEIGMPLLTVPDPVPFIAVTKAVFAYRARAERQELEWSLQTQRALTAAAVTPGGLLGILAAHRDATGRSGVVIDLLGRVLAESDPGGTRLVRRMSGVLESIREQGLTAAAADISDGR